MAGRKHIAIVVFVFLTTGAAVVGRVTFPGNIPVEPVVQASAGQVAEGQRIFRFDTFGDHFHSQVASQGGNSANDFNVLVLLFDSINERAIDL